MSDFITIYTAAATLIGSVVASGVVTLLALLSPFLIIAFRKWYTATEKSRERRRKMYADAYATCIEYMEYPFIIYRRNHLKPEDERARVSTALANIQKEIGYYQLWLGTESPDVAKAYNELVGSARSTAGEAMKDAWRNPVIDKDKDMIVKIPIDLKPTDPFKAAYIKAVREELKPWYMKSIRFGRHH